MSSQTIFVTKGSTDVTIDVGPILQDAGATNPGNPFTGLAYNDSGLICYYREGATGTVTQLTLATQTVGGAHADGGLVELSAGNMPGMYRLDLSDTIVSGTNNRATLVLSGATDMAAHTVHIVLTNVDFYDGVRGGMTALPNAAADAAGGLPVSDTGGLDLDTRLGYLTAAVATATALATAQTDLDTLTGADGVTLATSQPNLTPATAADVNAQVLDVLNTDTFAELAGVPAATSTLVDKLTWIFMQSRNKMTQTATTSTLRNDADGADVSTSTVSDNGTTFTRGEWS